MGKQQAGGLVLDNAGSSVQSKTAASAVADPLAKEVPLAAALASASVAAKADREIAALQLQTAEHSADAASRLRHFTAIEVDAASAMALDAEVRAALAALRVPSKPDLAGEAATATPSASKDDMTGHAKNGPAQHRLSVSRTADGADTCQAGSSRRWSIEGEYDKDHCNIEDVVAAAALELAASAAVRRLKAAEADFQAAETLAAAMNAEVEAANVRLLDFDVRSALSKDSIRLPTSMADIELDNLDAAVKTQLAALQAQVAERDGMVAALERKVEELSVGAAGENEEEIVARSDPMIVSDFLSMDETIRLSLQA